MLTFTKAQSEQRLLLLKFFRNQFCNRQVGLLSRTSGIFLRHPLNKSPLRNDILSAAGKPGDRWAGLRKKAGREESPDTVVFASCAWDENPGRAAPQTKGQRAW